MASMIVSVVSKATFGLLRKLAAEKLKEGDVVDTKLRGVIVDKIYNINTKLDAIAGKDLAASMSFFMDGLVYLEKVLIERMTDREKPERDEGATQAVGAVVGIMEEECLAEKIKNLQLVNLDEAARKFLEDARKRFEDARRKAVEAFGNAALSTPDRLLAMAIRIMATLLEQVQDLKNALASCKLCLQELHSLAAVQENFKVQLKGSFKSKFGQDERTDIIVAVCLMNRVVYDVIQMANEGVGVSKARQLLIWPCVDVGEERIHPLRDSRIARKLCELGMEQFCIQPWSFGQEGKQEHRLKSVRGIATNTKGQFIIADDKYVKVFDSSGKLLNSFSPPDDGLIQDVTTDRDDNMYVLKEVEDEGRGGGDVYVFDTQAKLRNRFRIRPGYILSSLVVDVSNKVLVSVTEIPPPTVSERIDEPIKVMVEVYDGRQLLHRVEVMCEDLVSCLISTTGDGHVLVLDRNSRTLYLFSPQKDYPLENKVQLRQPSPNDRPRAMTFHQASENLFIASFNEKSGAVQVSLYNIDGELVCSIPLETEPVHELEIKGIVVTNNGRIAVAMKGEWETFVLVV